MVAAITLRRPKRDAASQQEHLSIQPKRRRVDKKSVRFSEEADEVHSFSIFDESMGDNDKEQVRQAIWYTVRSLKHLWSYKLVYTISPCHSSARTLMSS